MDSLTKRRVRADELAAMVRRAFGAAAEVAAFRELPDGSYNAAYLVTLAGAPVDPADQPGWSGVDLVLKVAPDPSLRLLTHEVDLMRTEVDFNRRAAAVGVPVPDVVYADFSRTLLKTDYAFLSRVPGAPLESVRESLTDQELAALRGELAGITARLHAVTGPAFGYPLRGSRSWQGSWRAAFGAMVDDLLADARRLGSDLPASPDRIGALMHRHDDALDAVDRPALVHFDLWDGNAFVERGPDGGWRVTGLIDGERAFFGDPVAELVSLALFRDLADAPEVLAGYPMELTAGVRRRLTLYTAYLYLIMSIEGVTRGFDSPEYAKFRQWVLELLDTQLARL
jgi:aminoglycoside phosphotransferase (APT) family kinase protein